MTLYLEPHNNACRHFKSRNDLINGIKSATVTTTGKKYFTVSTNEEYPIVFKFYIDSMLQYCNGFAPDYMAYFSKEEILNKLYAEEVRVKMATAAMSVSDFKNVHIDDIKKIDEILSKYPSLFK
jgi:hypothetical protein